jgi:hypothetical protein
MSFQKNKPLLVSGLFTGLVLITSFQNCSDGLKGFKTADVTDPLLLHSNSESQRVDPATIPSDAIDYNFFKYNGTLSDQAFVQTQLLRVTSPLPPDAPYVAWIIAIGLYRIYSETTPANHLTEYELKIVDIDGLPMCPTQTGQFSGLAFTFRSACSALNITRKVKVQLKYRLEGQSWQTYIWNE